MDLWLGYGQQARFGKNVYTYVSTSPSILSSCFVGGRVSHLTRTSTRVATDESAALIICFCSHGQ